MQLLRAREAVMQQFRPHLRQHGLTEQQWRIMRALFEADSLEMQEIGGQTGIHPASLSRIIPKLDEAGIVRRRTDKDDQRRVVVSLTPTGRAFFKRVARESEEIYTQISDLVGARQMKALYAALDHVIETLETDEADTSSQKLLEEEAG